MTADQELLRVEGVSRAFDVSEPWLNRALSGGQRQLLRAVSDVSFSVAKGQTFGLVGESGCGKSTLARLLVGLDQPTRGAVRFDGHVVGGPDWSQHRRRVQMVFQDPFASLNPRWRVDAIVAEPIHAFGLARGRNAVRARVGELLTLVGLDARDGHKYPHQFSGGQRQRIAIARALASEAQFIVCDEPTSALDVSVQAQVINLMKSLQAQFGLTYVIISHDLAVVRHMSDRIGVMYLGRLVEEAETARIFESPQHPYTEMLLNAVPDLTHLDNDAEASSLARAAIGGEIPSPIAPPPGCAFHPRCPKRFDPCDQSIPQLLTSQFGGRVACFAAETREPASHR